METESVSQSRGGDFYQLLASVPTLQHADESARRILESVFDGLFILQLAFLEPRRELRHPFAKTRRVVDDQKAFHLRAVHYEQREEARSCFRVLEVIQRDLAADTDARVQGQVEQHRVGDRSSDIVEVDVHTARAELFYFRAVVGGGLVIESAVEAEVVDQVADLRIRARNADHAASEYFGDLSYDRSHRSGRSGNHDGLAGLGMADIDQSEVGGQTDVAEHAERSRNRGGCGIDLAQRLTLRNPLLLPTGIRDHDVAWLQARIVRLLDLAECTADHHLSDLHARGVRFRVVHAASHVGIERQGAA